MFGSNMLLYGILIGIALLLVVLVVILVVNSKRISGDAKAEGDAPADKEAEKAEEASEKEVAEQVVEEEKTIPEEVLAVEEPPAVSETVVEKAPVKKKTRKAPAKKKEIVKEPVEEVAEEAPAEEPVEAPVEAPAEEPVAEPVKEKAPSRAGRVSGKYDFILGPDGYHYCLLANNGQLLYQSIGYTTYEGAQEAVDTFKRAVASGKFGVRHDRGGRYSYVVDGKFYGEGYNNRQKCESAIDSVKRFADTTNFVDAAFSQEAIAEHKAVKAGLKKATDIDWAAVEKEIAALPKSGKFMVDPEQNGASFALLANNGQCLYTSRIYSDVKSAQGAVEAFKKAVCVGNFFATKDKFGNHRFALKGNSSNWYVGDSYAEKDRCLNAIESVKRFAKTAEVVVNKPEDISAE